MSTFQAHRRGEGQLPGSGFVQDARSVEERLLRLARQAALHEEPPGCCSHGEDPRDPYQEPRDLRLPEGTRRVAFAWSKVRQKASSAVNESQQGSEAV